MANSISHASLPYPIKNARYSIQVPYLDADGDPLDPTTPDTEVSQDGGAFADAAEEMTTISGSNGLGYITLTGAETNNSAVGVCAKVASGPKATIVTLYPRNLPILASGTASAGASGTLTLASSITYDVTGCFLRTTGGTGGGGTGGASNQARRITAYNTGTQVATVTPNWETTPDNTTTYDILCPEGVTPGMLKALNPATAGRTVVVDASGLVDANTVKVGPSGSGTAQTARDVGASVLLSSGTGTGQLDFTSGVVKSNVTQFNGSNATSSSGRPEVNTTHIAGSAVSTSSAQIGVNVVNLGGSAVDATSGLINANVKQISTDATAADNAESFFDGTGYAGTNNVVPTVTTLTNDPSGVTTLLSRLTATRAGYLDNLSAGAVALASSLTSAASDITTILGKFTGITALAQWLGAMAGKQTANSTARTEIRATGAGSGTFDETTDSLEANRDNLGTNGAALSLAKTTNITGFNDLSAAQVNTEADTALSDVGVTTTVTGRIDAAISTRLASASYTAPLDASGTRTAIGLASANLDTQLGALFTTAMTESYNGDGVAPTPAQALFVIMQRLTEFSITGTTITTKKLNGSTTAYTLTIDDATSPTSSTRAT